MDYQDIQVQVFEVGGGPLFAERRHGRDPGCRVRADGGADTAAQSRAVALGYTDAEYTDLNPPTTDLAASLTLDARLPNTPEWTASTSAEYSVPIPHEARSHSGSTTRT